MLIWLQTCCLRTCRSSLSWPRLVRRLPMLLRHGMQQRSLLSWGVVPAVVLLGCISFIKSLCLTTYLQTELQHQLEARGLDKNGNQEELANRLLDTLIAQVSTATVRQWSDQQACLSSGHSLDVTWHTLCRLGCCTLSATRLPASHQTSALYSSCIAHLLQCCAACYTTPDPASCRYTLCSAMCCRCTCMSAGVCAQL
jgi:hypothetical protein